MQEGEGRGTALEGLLVLELCTFVAGPFCAKLLADMGADVIKVEPPGAGDESRGRGPFYHAEAESDVSLLFVYLNANKRGITLNVDAPEGRDLLHSLLGRVDVLIEDLPSGDLDRLGLGYPSLHQVNPGLLVTSITPFGRTGPYKDLKSYYLNTYHAGGDGYLLPSGRLPDQLYPDREPIKAGGYLGEYQAGLSAAGATAAALVGKLMDGLGRHIDVSKQETLIGLDSADYGLYANRGVPLERKGLRLPHYVGGLYRCKDGFWQMVLPSQRQWEGLVNAMGGPAWAAEERFATQESRVVHRDEVDELIEAWAMGHTRQEIYESLQGEGVAAGPAYATEELLEDPQMEHRGFLREMEHPTVGKYRAPSAPYNFSGTPWAFSKPAPGLGEHNQEIYGGLIGYGAEEMERLEGLSVI